MGTGGAAFAATVSTFSLESRSWTISNLILLYIWIDSIHDLALMEVELGHLGKYSVLTGLKRLAVLSTALQYFTLMTSRYSWVGQDWTSLPRLG